MQPTPTFASSEPVVLATPGSGWWPVRGAQTLNGLILLVAFLFLALHTVHIAADFPNNSEWKDWAKYTDEGWYGDAAIRHYHLGHWNVPGDFNPAAALPVWPLVEMAVFRVTGVSLAAARELTVAVFALILAVAWLLLRRWPQRREPGVPGNDLLTPSIAVLLLAVSPFCFVFGRMAILEPLLILLNLCALHVATSAGRAPQARRSIQWAVVLGVLLTLMILTKTTAVFLFPAIFWMLWAACGTRLRPFLRTGIAAFVSGGALWGAYYGLFVHPHFLVDYRYLFSANAYTKATFATLGSTTADMLTDGMWIDTLLYPASVLAVIATLASFVFPRWIRRDPLATALVLWVGGYASFLVYHNNLQPRYYLVLAIPLTLLVPRILEVPVRDAFAGGQGGAVRRNLVRGAGAAAILFLLVAAVRDARQTVDYVRHPEYTFVIAAREIDRTIKREIAADPTRSPLVLSISGSDLSLMTGLPSICDDFGTLSLPDRIAKYHPGWFLTWNEVDDDKMEALAPTFRLERAGSFPAMDDSERNLLILYRLDPARNPSPPPSPHARVHSLSPPFHTKIGQQPSEVQKHH